MPPEIQKEYELPFFIETHGVKGKLHVYESTLLAILAGRPIQIQGIECRLEQYVCAAERDGTGNYQEQPSAWMLHFKEV